jgi:hypothetical protein
MLKDYGVIFKYDGVLSIATTLDKKWLFACSGGGGTLKQISLGSQQLVHDHGEIHRDRISYLETTRDSEWLINSSLDNHVKRISVGKREFDTDFGRICDSSIMVSMKITADDEKLIVGDNLGHMKLISLRDGQVIKDFGQVHDDIINGIVISADRKFFFTSSYNGELKQWNYEDNTLVIGHGKINNCINTLCL